MESFDEFSFADKIKPYRPSIDLNSLPVNLEEGEDDKFELTSYMDGGDDLEDNNLAMIEKPQEEP